MNISRKFFVDIGAKIATKKCFSFAADSKTRDFLAQNRWDKDGLQIPTVSNFRDIGTHLNLTQANNGKTLSDRIQKAIQMAKRLRWIPITNKQKEHIILSNVLPAGLYGVEAAWANKAAVKTLRSAIANALGPRSARASCDMVSKIPHAQPTSTLIPTSLCNEYYTSGEHYPSSPINTLKFTTLSITTMINITPMLPYYIQRAPWVSSCTASMK